MTKSPSSPTLAVSIIIPTASRPLLLKRAIDSCLTGPYADRTEVVVVPNGSDLSWQTVRDDYEVDSRVRFHYSAAPDRDIARNTGITLARGELIRFLDDDDFLLSGAAARQYELLLTQPADFCSGGISIEDREGNHLKDIFQPKAESGTAAVMAYNRLQIPLAHVFRRSSIGALRWPVGTKQSEDILWLISYVVEKERSWLRLDEPVGVWYQHDGPRMSLNRPSGVVHEPTALALLEGSKVLAARGTLCPRLALTIGCAIWECIHRAFPFRPLYWTKVAWLAMHLAPEAKPTAPIYNLPINPLLLQWLLLPQRWTALSVRAIKAKRLGWDYRREL